MRAQRNTLARIVRLDPYRKITVSEILWALRDPYRKILTSYRGIRVIRDKNDDFIRSIFTDDYFTDDFYRQFTDDFYRQFFWRFYRRFCYRQSHRQMTCVFCASPFFRKCLVRNWYPKKRVFVVCLALFRNLRRGWGNGYKMFFAKSVFASRKD